MNIRRVASIAFIFGAVLIGITLYANAQAAPSDTDPTAANTEATTQPAGAEAAKATPAEAAGKDSRPTMKAPAAKGASYEWGVRKGVSGRKYTIGSLDSPDDGTDAEGYLFQVELVPDGAAISTVKLRKYFATVADKKLADEDIEAYHDTLDDNPGKLQGHYRLLNPIPAGSQWTDEEGKTYRQGAVLPLATGSIKITFADDPDHKALPWDLSRIPWLHEKTSPDRDSQSISFSWTPLRKDPKTGKYVAMLKLTKTYTIRKDDYTIDVSLKVENLSSGSLDAEIDQYGPTGVPKEDNRADMRRMIYGAIRGEDNDKPQMLAEDREGDLEDAKIGVNRKLKGASNDGEPVVWVGQDNKFFGSMMYLNPAVEAESRLAAPGWKARFYYASILESDTSSTHMTGVTIPRIQLGAGESKTMNFSVFCGPKRRDMFVDEDAENFKQIYKDLDYGSTIQLRSCFCGWDALSLAMMWLLRLISTVTFGNFGVAIFILVILVRLVLHPMTKKSQLAMSKMKTMGPMMKELEKKYADDKEALNRERVRMYKQQGAGPMLLGCLPMLLQMPILIALYTSINASIDLRHAAFLPVWIIDLAAPDRLFTWTKSLPLIGTEFNLLPFLLGGAMYWQMKLSPQSNQVGATPDQKKQQKMMGVMMPVMMMFIFYKMSSGLTLYFLASTFFGAAESHFIRKHIEAKEALTAAMETTVRMPGKAARGSRPKKPKGPGFVKGG